MNILQKCSLVDRQRSILISLDELIDDRFGSLTDLAVAEPLDFYLLLYFNANWLPEVSNAALNHKLSEFYRNENERKKFELLFISSDKTLDQFNAFLNKNTFIRYSLFFEDQDLKSQLCKYLNINGIPYLTIVHLTLDANLKVINFQAEKTNVKHDFLADTEGINFPWLKPKVESSRAAMDESSDDEHVPLGECNAAEESSNSNLRFLNETIKKLSPIVRSESATGGRFLDPRKLRKSVNFVFMAFSSSTNVQLDVKLVESFVDFSKRFSAKHKFIFAYINVKPHESQSKYLSGVLNSNDLDWYTIHDLRYQKRVCKFYQVTMVPKLVVIDIRTGRVMNSRLKQCIVEFSHEFCEKRENNEETSTTSVSTTTATSSSDSEEASVVTVEEVAVKQCSNPEPVVSDPADELAHTSTETNYSDDDKFYNLNNIDKVQNIKFDFSNLNFNFETFDLVEHELFTEKSKRKKRASSTTTAAETASVCKKSKMKLLSEATLKQLNENLMDLSTGSKIAVKQEACEGSRPLHLLYFCSNSTVNEIYLQNVLNFLKYMQEKVRCSVRVVLVSLDEARGDYEQLVSKFAQKRRSSVRRVDELEKSSAERFVVDFEAAGVVREKLEKAFSISDLPHFSLIDSQNGQILSENLKIFILNSQLRDIVF